MKASLCWCVCFPLQNPQSFIPLLFLNTLCQDLAAKAWFYATQLSRCRPPYMTGQHEVVGDWGYVLPGPGQAIHLNTALPSCAPSTAVLPPDLTSLQIPPCLFLTLPGPSHPCPHAWGRELPFPRTSNPEVQHSGDPYYKLSFSKRCIVLDIYIYVV